MLETSLKPPTVDKKLASSIYKLHSVTKCLEESLDEIIYEQNNLPDGESSISESEVILTDAFRNQLLSKYGEAIIDAYDNQHDKNQLFQSTPTGATERTESEIPQPPAAILTGKIQHYNRYEGNWRIVISDAEIRPRVNIPYCTDKSESGKRSLVQNSSMEMEKIIKRAKKLGQKEIYEGNNIIPTLNDDGSWKIDGDVVILAYDDDVPKS